MVWLLFFLSGATGLIYEVLWTRRLTLTFGHTILAVSTVLTAFMAGLALGSLAGGYWSDRRRILPGARFLRNYGWLEVFIGVWAILSLPLLSLAEKVYFSLSHSGWEGRPLHVVCCFLCLLVLLPPTAAMGASLPVITQHLVDSTRETGVRLARLYGVNTTGAVVGAGLAGYVLLPTLGLQMSILAAACANLLIGAVAIIKGAEFSPAQPLQRDQEKGSLATSQGVRLTLAACFACTGLASMAFQIAWTRALALSLGSSVYAFSTILVVFLAGLGLGSLLYGLIFRRRRPSYANLASLQSFIGLSALFTVPLLGVLPQIYFYILPYVTQSFPMLLASQVCLAALVLIIPTLLLGLTFPMVTHLFAESEGTLGKSIGMIYGANSLGCIVGSFVSGFLLVPHLGVQRTLEGACLLVFAAAIVVFLLSSSKKWALVPLIFSATLALVPTWNPGVMGSGVTLYGARHTNADPRTLRATLYRRPAYFKDGLSSTVSVQIGPNEGITVRVNGKTDASFDKPDLLTMYFTGWLPMLYNPKAESAVVVGLGSGCTLTALSQNPNLKEIHCVELEAAMVESNRYWTTHNEGVLNDPRVRTHVSDGRTFVLSSPRKFDLVISEPSNPWIAGIGNLFTRDYYQACREKLNPGGVMCQWCNLYAVSLDDVQSVMRSFFEVFPYGDVWESAPGDIILIGSNEPLKPDIAWFGSLQRSNSWRAAMNSVDLPDAYSALGHYICSRQSIWDKVKATEPNTDDCPTLEFSAPRSLHRHDRVVLNRSWIHEFAKGDYPVKPPADKAWSVGYGLINVESFELLERITKDLPDSPHRALFQGVLARIKGGDSLAIVKKAFETTRSPVLALEMAKLALGQNLAKEALAILSHADPAQVVDVYRFKLHVGLALDASQRVEEAAKMFGEVCELTHRSTPRTFQASCLARAGKLEPALAAANDAIKRNPCDLTAWNVRGKVSLDLQKWNDAVESFTQQCELDPDDVEVRYLLALALSKQGRTADAIRQLKETLRLQPDFIVAEKLLRELK